MTKHILVALVEDKPGVLNRVSSLLRRRNFNIDSIAVGKSAQPDLTRMTLVVDGDNVKVDQVRKQLDKLIDVVKIVDITEEYLVARELALLKVNATPATRSEIIQIVNVFRANIVDVSADFLMVEVTGDENKINSLLDLLHTFGISEIARTGCIALTRGNAIPLLAEDTKLPRQRRRASRKKAETPPDW